MPRVEGAVEIEQEEGTCVSERPARSTDVRHGEDAASISSRCRAPCPGEVLSLSPVDGAEGGLLVEPVTDQSEAYWLRRTPFHSRSSSL